MQQGLGERACQLVTWSGSPLFDVKASMRSQVPQANITFIVLKTAHTCVNHTMVFPDFETLIGLTSGGLEVKDCSLLRFC